MKRPEVPLGFGGDYVSDSTEADENAVAINLFLDAVTRLVPECLSDLASIAADVPERYGGQGDAILNEWARRWGFASRKLVRVARLTAGAIRDCRHDEWVKSGSYWCPDFPRFVNPSWNPIEESEASFRARVEEYVRQVKATPGIVAAPTKRNLEHFEWLALHQVAGWKFTRIAEHYQDEKGLEVSTVSRAVKETAAIIGLTLRLQ